MRRWEAHQKISGKTVDLLKKEGFDSMEALILIDSDDLSQTKIQRGQQILKLLLKALLSLKSSGEETGSAATTGGDDTPATGMHSGRSGRDHRGGRDARGREPTTTAGRTATGRLHARLMANHMRSMQGMQSAKESWYAYTQIIYNTGPIQEIQQATEVVGKEDHHVYTC